MNENNNIPQLFPADQLQEVHRQHLYDRRCYRYFDREGRLAWTNKEGYNHYTWYLYNADGEIIEIGDSYINAGALGHVVTVYQCTTAEAGEFIRNKAGKDNVLRLAPPEVTEVAEMHGPKPIGQPVLTVPVTTGTQSTPVEVLPPTKPQTQQTTTKTDTTTNETCFADQVLAAIFSSPEQHDHTPVPATHSQIVFDNNSSVKDSINSSATYFHFHQALSYNTPIYHHLQLRRANHLLAINITAAYNRLIKAVLSPTPCYLDIIQNNTS